ncbi:MAG: acyl carrier protein [Ardenticatenaceae bacterium]|nr:acyl carrier protein [Anaerolineales bacterium]MCB9008632.1 acyl carrier protein [Ardenticatenaceae bacterium]
MNVKEQIRAFIAENFLFNPDGFDLSDDASFLDEGVVDSTGTLELVMFVEETFGIEVGDNEIEPENFDSVNKLAAYVARKGQLAVS